MHLAGLSGVALLAMAGSAGAQEQRTPSGCTGLAANSVEAAILHCHGEVTVPAVTALLGQDPLNEATFPSDVPLPGWGTEAVGFMDLIRAPTVLDIVGQVPPLAPRAARAGPLVQIDGQDWATEQQRARSSVEGAAEPSAREGFWQAPPHLVPLTPTAEPHAEVDGQTVSMDQWLEGSFLDKLVDPVPVEPPGEDHAPALAPSTETMRSAVIDGVTVDFGPVSYELLGLIRRSAGVADTEERPAPQAEVLEELGE
jgi:hypothetical protein